MVKESASTPRVAVLVVDDEVGMRDMLAFALSTAGYEVATAEDGPTALSLMANRRFDLTITDLNMPGMDGVELVGRIKALHPEAQIIVATGYATVETAIACMKGGAYDYIQKPCNIGELKLLLERALEHRRLAGQVALYNACQGLMALKRRHDLPQRAVELARANLACDVAGLVLETSKGPRITCAPQTPDAKRLAEVLAAEHGASQGVEVGLASGEMPAGWSSGVVLPLTVADRRQGALVLLRRQGAPPFGADERHAGTVFAAQLALALQNAHLMGALQTRLEALSDAHARLVAAERLAAVGQVAASVAHEVNNPASYVLANLVFVKKGVESMAGIGQVIKEAQGHLGPVEAWWHDLGGDEYGTELSEAARDAHEGALRIKDIARDMRSLARSGQDLQAVYNLNEAVRSALRVAGSQTSGRAELITHLGQGLEVRGSSGRMVQALVNLIVNAAHATEAVERDRHTITITTQREGDQVVALVADTGPGIDRENLEKIFEPFYTTKRAGQGTGLGLSIVREIISMQHGEISVSSQPGAGTTFKVAVPAARPISASFPVVSIDTTEIEALPKLGRGLKVLFIEPDANMRRSYTRFFGSHCEPLLAETGQSALAIIEAAADKIDVVVCALPLKDVDALALWRRVKVHHEGLAARFIFVTASAHWAHMQSVIEEISNPVLHKPLDINRLRETIASVTSQHRQSQPGPR